MAPPDLVPLVARDSAPGRARRTLPLLGTTPPPVAAVTASGPRSARLSITDRCDFACTYCRPSRSDGYYERRIGLGEWTTLVTGLVASGIRRFRLTGGEPLVHPDVVEIVRLIATSGATDVALTTNASQLERLAVPLKQAGLQRVNVSIDSLDPARFEAITRGGDLSRVLRGIDAAIAAGLEPIKLNIVVLRDVNDDEIEPLVRYAWERRMVPRFLEVMPIAEGAKLAPIHLVPVVEMQARLAHLLVAEDAQPEPDRGPARYLTAAHDPSLRVGFISGTSDTYCGTCDRLRVSSQGELRPCLATDDGVDASGAARAGDPALVPALLREAWSKKPDGRIFKGCTEESASRISMRAIGG